MMHHSIVVQAHTHKHENGGISFKRKQEKERYGNHKLNSFKVSILCPMKEKKLHLIISH